MFTTQTFTGFGTYVNLTSWVPGLNLPGTSGASIYAPRNAVGTTSQTELAIIGWVTINSPGLAQATVNVNVSAALTATTTWRLFISQTNQGPSLALT